MDLAHWEALFFGVGGCILVFLLCFDTDNKKKRRKAERRRRRKGYNHSEGYSSEEDGSDDNRLPAWRGLSRGGIKSKGSDSNSTTTTDEAHNSGSFSWDSGHDNPPTPGTPDRKRSSYFGLSSSRGLLGIRGRSKSSPTVYNSGGEEDLVPKGKDKDKAKGSPSKEKSNSNAALDLFFTSADFESANLIDQKVNVKKGLLITLGGKKMMEKSPTVKQRMFFLRGYYLSYTDSFGMKKELDLRWCALSKHKVTGTSGVGDGQPFFAISFEANGGNLLLGASSESYR